MREELSETTAAGLDESGREIGSVAAASMPSSVLGVVRTLLGGRS